MGATFTIAPLSLCMGATLRMGATFTIAPLLLSWAWVPRSPLHHCHIMGATFTIAPLSWVPLITTSQHHPDHFERC